MNGYCDKFSRDYVEMDVAEAHIYMRHHKGAKLEYFYVSNVVYHKFTNGAISYTLKGENINVMLE